MEINNEEYFVENPEHYVDKAFDKRTHAISSKT